MHLLILPGPNQRAANQVLDLVIYRHATEAGGDERIAVTDGNHFFAFERQKEKLENRFARWFAIISAQQSIELFLGFLCDRFHGGSMAFWEKEATEKIGEKGKTRRDQCGTRIQRWE